MSQETTTELNLKLKKTKLTNGHAGNVQNGAGSALQDFDALLIGNELYVMQLYQKYLNDPTTVATEWREVFANLPTNLKPANEANGTELNGARATTAVAMPPQEKSLKSITSRASWDENSGAVVGVEKFKTGSLSDFLLKGIERGESLTDTLNRYMADKSILGQQEIEERLNSIRAIMLIRAFRTRGHMEAKLDPLELEERVKHPELDYHSYGFKDTDLDKVIYINYYLGLESAKLGDIIAICRRVYCGHFGIEFMHVQNADEKLWLQEKLESDFVLEPLASRNRKKIFEQILHADMFETFLEKKYKGTKRFGLDGGETTIPVLEQIIKRSSELGVEEINVGMAHRGRLNILANTMGKPYATIFYEFKGGVTKAANFHYMGDVKYHLGTSSDRLVGDRQMHLSLVPNPSHLEAVNTVVLGKVRAKQKQKNDNLKEKVLAVLLHGDAAFIGQGVVAETFLLSQLKGYRTGGTIHVAINNQIGFTTVPKDGRSSPYCTDMAKMIDAPVLHVNGDDPDVCVRAARLAVEYRQKFKKDIVIDIYCYRRHGHNEMDEPFFTQPLMYEKIVKHPHVREIYAQQLIAEQVLTTAEIATMTEQFQQQLEQAMVDAENFKGRGADWLEGRWSGLTIAESGKRKGHTGVELDDLTEIGKAITQVPSNFNLHDKIVRQMEQRYSNIMTGKQIDWSTAEALAFGSLLIKGMAIRFSGEDSQRGTFSQRHAVWIDQKTGDDYIPLNYIRTSQAKLEIINSPLSEFGLLGFEYGYACAEPFALVIWEAQFGDFANGAQVIIDQFIASGETKWLKMCGLVLLLPHGYEGQGPEHSSARLERYLQLSADDNWQVCNLTTPANYFHALRRQMKRNFRKPLVIMTPKSLLRHPLCVSNISDFAPESSFHRILPDDAFVAGQLTAPQNFRRVVFCSGKVYYDLYSARQQAGIRDIALVRLEQLYPFPAESLIAIMKTCLQAEFVWCQEEPKNAGAWPFVQEQMAPILRQLQTSTTGHLGYIGRSESASPATGSLNMHKLEQELLVKRALLMGKEQELATSGLGITDTTRSDYGSGKLSSFAADKMAKKATNMTTASSSSEGALSVSEQRAMKK